MFNYKNKFLFISLFITLLIIVPALTPITASYEFKVRPGAFMEYTVNDAKTSSTEGVSWWEQLDNNSYVQINITKGSKIRVDVLEANETHVTGTLLFPGNLKTSKKPLEYVYPNIPTGLPLIQQVTDKSFYQQMNLGNNQMLQGNLLTTVWEWKSNNGIQKQEERLNIVSGFVEFFSYIFLVNESIEEIFQITRSSPVTPGFEFPTIILPLIILGVILRYKVKRNDK